MRFILLFLLIFSLFSFNDVFSQEDYIDELIYNPVLTPKNDPSDQRFKKEIIGENFVYIIDTMKLPFIDDFARNKQKKFNAKTTDQNVSAQPWTKFTIQGVSPNPDSIQYSINKTYSYDKSGGKNDSTVNPPIILNLFLDITEPSKLIKTETVWPPYTIVISDTTTDTTSLASFITFSNLDSIYTVKDDLNEVWIDKKTTVFVNSSFGVNPITYGVATFEGLNELGEPYDFTSPASYGSADVLTSRPIDLVYLPSDSLVFSFYYQPKGIGEAPQKEDSLVLEFYSPSTKKWHFQWKTEGKNALENFKYVSLSITDPIFLNKGFQFRFRNFATLSGSFDHWNIDYVYLDKARSVTESTVKDFALKTVGSSFIKNYTSMPWEHYKSDATLKKFTTEEFPVRIQNMSNQIVNNEENMYSVYDDLGTLLKTSDVNLNRITGFPASSDTTINHSINKTAPANDFQFPVDNLGLVRKKFKIDVSTWQSTINNADEINHDNDTVSLNQVFDTYYSYDDGIAEKAYSVVEAGSKVANRYTIDVVDTLKAVLFYFPKTLEDITTLDFQIVVWKSIDPEVVLYQSDLLKPQYNGNEFTRYVIDQEVIVSGSFYVGWRQFQNGKLFVGLDASIDRHENIFYNTKGIWINTIHSGSLMIRPDFGEPELVVSSHEKMKSSHFSTILYPNPAKSELTILISGSENHAIQLAFYDITGRLVYNSVMSETRSKHDISSLESGIYFVVLLNTITSEKQTHKLIISK